MPWVQGDFIHGFQVVSSRESRELGGRVVRMDHGKTGARLCWLDNGEENMVFSIGFCTLPEDNTGVFHILEHSVLCGSRKYPVKEPFVELLKSSMNTFLNAITFPDMTLYPVSSRNRKDLLNLAEVYLDAVLHPVVMEDRKRFAQEGWHIDRDEEGNPCYRGVVFNEMKGSMSDTDTLIDRQLQKQLFPDVCYGFNSGGDPEAIPTLTYESFQERYRRFYHPSNAWIYLDGALPMEETLALIDRYLSEFSGREDHPVFSAQVPVASERTIYYELGQEEPLENRGHLTMGRIIGSWADRTENMARVIISDVLTGNNEAPLKREALERNLAEDLTLSIDDTAFQSTVMIHAENVTDGREEEIPALLREMGEKIAREGLDREAVEASMNRAVYTLREEEEPRGIGRLIRCMGGWMYGGDPGEILESEKLIEELKELLRSGKFDELAVDLLLNREGLAVLHSLPSHTLGEEKRRAETEELQRITSAWTAEEKAENDRFIEELEAWQAAPDSEESLRSLPKLTKEDADVAPEWIETEVMEAGGVPILFHRMNCGEIVHLRACFTLTDQSLEELTMTASMTGLLGRIATRRHDALKLQQEIKRYTGSIGFSVVSRADPGQDETCTPYLVASSSALAENAEKAQALIAEILTETLFTDTNRIQEIFKQIDQAARQRSASAGHVIAVRNVLSHFSADGAVRNALDGDAAIRYAHALAKDSGELARFQRHAEKTLATAFCRKRMIVSVTADREQSLDTLVNAFPEGTAVPERTAYRVEGPWRKGYRIPAQIGFAVKGYRLSRCGASFSGSKWLMGSILTLDYLWNRVRVQGGAYGAGFQLDRAGNVFTYSYRDPTPAKTLQTNAGMGDFMRSFAEHGDDLDQYIISALNELNPLLGPREKGALADNRWLTGFTREEAEKTRREVLNTTMEDLVACAQWLEQFDSQGAVCVVGHSDALSACDELDVSEL